MKTQVIRGTSLLVLFSIGVGMNLELMPVRRSQFSPGADEIPFTWNPTLYKMMSFGQVSVATDWLLIKFLTTPEWKHVAPGKRARPYYDLELATELDPSFYSLYTAGAHFLTVVRNDNEGALRIIEKGERFRREKLPNYPQSFRDNNWAMAWRIPFIKAFIEMFEMGDFPAAAKSLSVIDEFPDAPEHLKKLSVRLLDPIQRYDVGERVLHGMIYASKQEKEKEALNKKLAGLETSRFLAQANLNFDDYLKKKYGKKLIQQSFSREALERELAEFSKKRSFALKDGRGGKLFISSTNRIETTTKRENVFGLE